MRAFVRGVAFIMLTVPEEPGPSGASSSIHHAWDGRFLLHSVTLHATNAATH